MGRILAHGTGPGHDLPIPLFYAVAGGALAVFASFLAVGILWPESRLRGATAGRPAAVVHLIVDTPAINCSLRLVVLVGAVFVVIAAATGLDDPHENPCGRLRVRRVLGGPPGGVAAVRAGVAGS